ncbi:hypothetical protein [Hymenobacter defluvii]|uniref:Uncharacterized protein n=1 Tax=Hymenobacter defluvii TaxID=2054411 RepID=A0ABS3T661_9BACT|nr:hypothetical protein [Hymenobacter defluvii]MBO3269116.1 hypothetical protein [Hymenobacter defluvii]
MDTLRVITLIIKQLGVPLTTIIAIGSAAAGLWLSLKQYRLKTLSETRLNKAASIEADINLMKLFSELMNTAHARNTYQVSEKAIEMLLQQDTMRALLSAGTNMSLNTLLSQAVISIPVGAASQDAAIAAIATLGKKHEVLLDAAIQGLESLSHIKGDVTDKYILELKQLRNNL